MTWPVTGVCSHLFAPFPRSKRLQQASKPSSDGSLLHRGSRWVFTLPPHLHYDTKRPQRRREQWRQRNVQKSVTHVQIVTFLKFLLPSPSSLLKLPNNKPLPSSKNPHFQNEAKFTAFLVKMSFICMRMKNHFHIKGWALNLVLIPRPEGTRTWPIHRPIGQNNNRADC